MHRFLLLIFIPFIFSCNNDDNAPDVSHIKVDISIQRFEQDFFKLDTSNIVTGIKSLEGKYPLFTPFFLRDLIGVNDPATSDLTPLKMILTAYKPINDSIQKKYPDFNWLQEDLESSFKYVKYYFPKYEIPKLITFIASFDIPGVIITKDHIGIGLHQFAGKNFSVYQLEQLQQMYPYYISRRFDKEYMAASVMKAVADDLYPDKSVGKAFIEQVIEKGKQWYLLDKFLPHAPDSIKTGYSSKQLEWVESNEGNLWAHITKNENLYSIEPHVIQTYLGESPFTQGMPEVSPGNIGQWIGWKIVEQYVEKNPELSVQQIIAAPARTIFETANYRPK